MRRKEPWGSPQQQQAARLLCIGAHRPHASLGRPREASLSSFSSSPPPHPPRPRLCPCPCLHGRAHGLSHGQAIVHNTNHPAHPQPPATPPLALSAFMAARAVTPVARPSSTTRTTRPRTSTRGAPPLYTWILHVRVRMVDGGGILQAPAGDSGGL